MRKKILEKTEDKSNEDIVKKTQKKNKEDKRILDFFTDFFDPENEEEKPVVTKKKTARKRKKAKDINFKETQSNIKKEPANSSLQRNDINADEDNKEKRILDFFSKFFKPNEQDEEKIKSELNFLKKPIKLKNQLLNPAKKNKTLLRKQISFEIKEVLDEPNISTEETDLRNLSKNNLDNLGNTLANEKDLNQEYFKKYY